MSTILSDSFVLWAGLWQTLLLSVISSCLALPLGCLTAVMRVSPVRGFRLISTIYVALVRNVPLVVIFFFSAFVLPQFGVRLSYFDYAVIALVTYYGTFFGEAIRSGINAIPVGQAEAARSIGLGAIDVLRFVVLPQALRTSLPPIVNVLIALIKNTALASAFGVGELIGATQQLANTQSTAVLSILVVTALIYLVITIPLGLLSRHLEHREEFAR